MEEREFNFNKFWGTDDDRRHVVFKRKSDMACIYCGEEANTREHCPSKVFLQPPLPTDLPVLPACSKCNNDYSKDEKHTNEVIKALYRHYIEPEEEEICTKEGCNDAKEYLQKFTQDTNRIFDERLGRIFTKLAIGHAAYEISEGYYTDNWDGTPLYVSYTIRPFLSEEEWGNLEYAELINDDFLPELGSRVFRNIYVIQIHLMSSSKSQGKENKMINACFMDWTEVQDGFYKYIAFMRDDKIIVRIIIKEFLYVEVVFQKEDGGVEC